MSPPSRRLSRACASSCPAEHTPESGGERPRKHGAHGDRRVNDGDDAAAVAAEADPARRTAAREGEARNAGHNLDPSSMNRRAPGVCTCTPVHLPFIDRTRARLRRP